LLFFKAAIIVKCFHIAMFLILQKLFAFEAKTNELNFHIQSNPFYQVEKACFVFFCMG